MKGSLATSLVNAFGLFAFASGNTQAIAIPSTEYIAQATAGNGINRPLLKAGSQGTAVSELQGVLKLLGYYTDAVDGAYGQTTAIAVSQFQKAAGLNSDGIVNSKTWERLFPLAPTEASSAAAFPVPATTTKTPPPATNTSAPNTTRATNPKPASTPTPSTPKPAKPTTSKAPTPRSTEVNLPVLRLGIQSAAVKRLQQRLQAVGLFNGSVDGVFGSQTEIAVKAIQSRYQLNPDGVVGSATWKVLDRQPPRTR